VLYALFIVHVLLCTFDKLSTSISGKVLLLHMHLPLPRFSKHHCLSSCHGLSHFPSDLSAASLPTTPPFPIRFFRYRSSLESFLAISAPLPPPIFNMFSALNSLFILPGVRVHCASQKLANCPSSNRHSLLALPIPRFKSGLGYDLVPGSALVLPGFTPNLFRVLLHKAFLRHDIAFAQLCGDAHLD
jgi:hypothetical protein